MRDMLPVHTFSLQILLLDLLEDYMREKHLYPPGNCLCFISCNHWAFLNLVWLSSRTTYLILPWIYNGLMSIRAFYLTNLILKSRHLKVLINVLKYQLEHSLLQTPINRRETSIFIVIVTQKTLRPTCLLWVVFSFRNSWVHGQIRKCYISVTPFEWATIYPRFERRMFSSALKKISSSIQLV